MDKWYVIVLLMALVLLPVTPVIGVDKIHPWLDKKLANGKEMEFLIIMKESTDLSTAKHLKSKADKGLFVNGELKRAAFRSQGSIRDWLKAHGVNYRAFHIVNAILVKGDRKLLDMLAARDDVERIEGNPEIRNLPPLPETTPSITASATGIEWNVSQVGAPDLWALGITGEGIVIGGSDTGYLWTHPALKGKYRGWNGISADHNYNWHDAIHSGGGVCGFDSATPCDDYGHGTHTIGIAVGDDGGVNRIGVAPGAKWIGCRNMNVGYGSPATYLECFEFFLAPYPIGGAPEQGDPSKAPDITINSWSCPVSEGCEPLTLQTAVNSMKAAGIMTVVSAGNTGSSCGSMTTPPAIYGSAYTVGSTNSDYTLSSFSSRGPAGTTGLVKPDIVSPGTSIRSASADGSYTSMSGTSMAAPHAAGGVALIWSAVPALKNDPDVTAATLNGSALRLPSIAEGCGGDYTLGPNNSWGYGLLDLHSAYDSSTSELSVTLQGTGTGIVTSSPEGISCPGTCSHNFGKGIEVTLSAVPGGNSIFSNWGGACSGSICKLTLGYDINVIAYFNLDMSHATRIDLPKQGDYPSLIEAYSAVSSGGTIKAWGVAFQGDLLCAENKSVTLKGGFDQNYSVNPGYTTLRGNLEIQRGVLVLERLVITQ